MPKTTGKNEFINRPKPIKNDAILSVAAKFNDNNNIGERERFERDNLDCIIVPIMTNTVFNIRLNKQPASNIGTKTLYK